MLGVRTSLIWALFPVRVWLEARRMMVSIFTLMWLCPHNLKLFHEGYYFHSLTGHKYFLWVYGHTPWCRQQDLASKTSLIGIGVNTFVLLHVNEIIDSFLKCTNGPTPSPLMSSPPLAPTKGCILARMMTATTPKRNHRLRRCAKIPSSAAILRSCVWVKGGDESDITAWAARAPTRNLLL